MYEQIDQVKNTRERVLHTLLTREECIINELAKAVDINPISVRHHITRLQADGLVDAYEERHGVGRPRRLYFLTEKGRELFPTRYLRLTLRLLEQLKETMPPNLVNQIFSHMAQDMAADYKHFATGKTMEQRLDLVKDLLNNEGFSVNWELQGELYKIHESNCPYFFVGKDHPEVCSVDQTLISTLLDVPAQKVTCKLLGDAHCTFIVPIPSLEQYSNV